MRNLKQSTAANVVVFMTDSTDHVTGKTGLTLTITASKDGAAFASISPTVTELATGWYKLALTSSHTDTLGDLALHVTATGADPTDFVCRVVAVDLADSVRFGLSALPNAAAGASSGLPLAVDASGRVDVLKINGTSQTARDIGASVLVSSGTGAGQISLSSGAVTVGTNNDKTGYTASTVSDKTGYSLTQSFPTNFSSFAIDSSGRVDVAKIGGTSQTARDIGASVLLSNGTGAGQVSLSSGKVSVSAIADNAITSSTLATACITSTQFADNAIASGKIATGAIGATVFGTGAISADALATDAVQEISAQVVSDMATSPVGSVAGSVTVGTNNDKTGYSLSSSGLNSISVSDPAGVASTFPAMLVQVWRYFFKKTTTTNTERKTYADDGTTVNTTQSISDNGTTLTKGNAS